MPVMRSEKMRPAVGRFGSSTWHAVVEGWVRQKRIGGSETAGTSHGVRGSAG